MNRQTQDTDTDTNTDADTSLAYEPERKTKTEARHAESYARPASTRSAGCVRYKRKAGDREDRRDGEIDR